MKDNHTKEDNDLIKNVIYLPEDLSNKIKEIAISRKVSLSKVVQDALELYDPIFADEFEKLLLEVQITTKRAINSIDSTLDE